MMVQHLDTPALNKQWVLDAQWTDCPSEIEKIVKAIWHWRELGNDNYMFRATLAEFKAFDTDAYDIQYENWEELPEEQKALSGRERGWVKRPVIFKPLVDYLVERGVVDDDEVILHWWW